MINTVCKELKYKRKQCGLAMSTGVQQPSARFCQVLPGSARFCQVLDGLLYFESNSCSFCDVYSSRHRGSRPERAIGSLLASPSGSCLEQTRDSDLQLALIHHRHAKSSRSPISTAWKLMEGGARILTRIVVTTCYIYVLVYCAVLDRTSKDSHSLQTVFIVQVSCLIVTVVT